MNRDNKKIVSNRRKQKFIDYLSHEIAIEYKACLYFFAIMFFYCIYLICNQKYQADILILAEIIASTYLIGYLQVYVLKNFDESDRFGRQEIIFTTICSLIYAAVSFLGGWFGRELWVTAVFFFFLMFAYWCVYFINKIKREHDTKHLNEMLTNFKKIGGGNV